jgi:hypothetical protein
MAKIQVGVRVVSFFIDMRSQQARDDGEWDKGDLDDDADDIEDEIDYSCVVARARVCVVM